MTTPTAPVPISDVDPATLATRLATPPNGAQGGRSAFSYKRNPSDPTEVARLIVIDLDRPDMSADGVTTHIGIGCTVYEVDTSGAVLGPPVPRWVHTAPIDVVGSGQRTAAQIVSGLESEAIQKLTNQWSAHDQLNALNLPAAPPADG